MDKKIIEEFPVIMTEMELIKELWIWKAVLLSAVKQYIKSKWEPCNLSNKVLSDWIWTSQWNISRYISELEKKWYLNVCYTKMNGGGIAKTITVN